MLPGEQLAFRQRGALCLPYLEELPCGLLLLLLQLRDQAAEVRDVAGELGDGTIDAVVDGQV